MKNIIKIVGLSIIALIVAACGGSDVYQGEWQANDDSGNHYTVYFEPKHLTITDSKGSVTESNYTQNSVHNSNGIKTYGIKLEDGSSYQVHFPIKNNENRAQLIIPPQSTSFSGITITQGSKKVLTLTRDKPTTL